MSTNKTKVQVEVTNNFSALFNNAEEATKSQSYSLVERSTQRKLQAAYDSGAARIDTLTHNIMMERKQLQNININSINNFYAEIEATQKAMEYTAKEYKHLFGTEIAK